nr:NosD domain-containing protein [Candidatus Freyarchaeota archaeon]
MNNSELHYCGYENSTSNRNHYGLWINTDNTIIENNTLTNNYVGTIIWYSHNNTIRNNTATDNHEGFWLEGSSNNTLTGNNATNAWYGFTLSYSSYNNLTGNTVTNPYMWGTGCFGFYMQYGTYNNLTGNTVTNHTYLAFYLIYSHYNNLTGNNATNNDYDNFNLYDSWYNTLTGNTATNNTGEGFFLVNSSYNTLTSNIATNNGGPPIYIKAGFHLMSYSDHNTLSGNTAINNTQYNFVYDGLNNNLAGSVSANFLRVKALAFGGGAVQGAQVKVQVDGNTIYDSIGFGGSNPPTDQNGLTEWIVVPYKTYVSGTTAVENITNVTVSYGGLYIDNNPRIVNMSTSHTETFIVDNVPPTVTITTPSNDTQVNTGVIYINGTFNGTGSQILSISINDPRFTLVEPSSSPYGITGTYSFKASNIESSEFDVQVKVRDQSGLETTATRHVIVEQPLSLTDILKSLTAILLLLTSNSQSGFSLLIYVAAGVAACAGVAAGVLFYYFRLRRV